MCENIASIIIGGMSPNAEVVANMRCQRRFHPTVSGIKVQAYWVIDAMQMKAADHAGSPACGMSQPIKNSRNSGKNTLNIIT